MRGRTVTCLITLAVVGSGGCYEADLDPTMPGVFVCEADIDCALGTRCIEGLCEQDFEQVEGPALGIESPAPLQIFRLGEVANLPLVMVGQGLVLEASRSSGAGGAQGGDDLDSGYVEVFLDGAIAGTVSDGDLESGVAVDWALIPTQPGLHHVTIGARRTSGEAFEGPSATASVAFWVDDGREQVGILEPPPGARIPFGAGGEFRVEVASLNFTFVNPGFIAPEEFDVRGEGYVHLYIDADVPGCLPACNFDYQSSIIPAGLSRVNRIIVERPVLIPDDLRSARIQIVAQNLSHTPYLRDSEAAGFVYHAVPVQAFLQVNP